MIKQFFPYLSERLTRSLDLQAEQPGDLAPFHQAVIISEDLTAQSYLWNRKSATYAAGTWATPTTGGLSSAALWRPRSAAFGQSRIATLRRATVFAVDTSGFALNIGYQVYPGNAMPFLTSSQTIDPTVRDSRIFLGPAVGSGMVLQVGIQVGVEPAAGADGWAIMRAAGGNGGQGGSVYDLNISVSMLNGAGVFFSCAPDSRPFGISLEWEERDGSTQEVRAAYDL